MWRGKKLRITFAGVHVLYLLIDRVFNNFVFEAKYGLFLSDKRTWQVTFSEPYYCKLMEMVTFQSLGEEVEEDGVYLTKPELSVLTKLLEAVYNNLRQWGSTALFIQYRRNWALSLAVQEYERLEKIMGKLKKYALRPGGLPDEPDPESQTAILLREVNKEEIRELFGFGPRNSKGGNDE